MQSNGPKNEALEAGGRETKKRKAKKKNEAPPCERLLHVWAPLVGLGRQRVVVSFAALALAAEDDGCGKEEKGGGDQEEQAEAGKDSHHLHRATTQGLG